MTDLVPPPGLDGLDITRPGFYLRDDYAEVLAWLRRNDPLHRLADGTTVLVSRYEDIREISRQPNLFSSRHGALVNDPLRRREPNDAAGSLLHLDPPMHADYRKLLNREFTPRAVARMEATVHRIVEEAFAALAEHGAGGAVVDLVEHLALPVPVRVIAELIGMGDEPIDTVRRWSDATIAVADDHSPEVLEAVTEFAIFLEGHVRARFEDPSAFPDHDLIALLARSTVGDEPLTQAQVQLFCMTLMVAGNETTRSLISGGALVLAQEPDQRAGLVAALGAGGEAADHAVAAAVEELLRWVTPIQAFCRTATADAELASGPVRAGDYLVLLYASGNRDEAVFGPTAGALDVARPASPTHVAFGFGEHLCLGASLARLEARAVLEGLLRRHPAYELAGDPVRTPSTLANSLATLPVRLG